MVVEQKYWGGVFLNVGCIPSKALLRNAELAHLVNSEADDIWHPSTGVRCGSTIGRTYLATGRSPTAGSAAATS